MSYRIPLVRPYLPSRASIERELDEMLDSGRLTNFGPFSTRLEAKTRELLGVGHTAAVSNATIGLTLILSTLPPESEVILPSFTFVATAQAVTAARLIPVFADIDSDTLNVDVQSVTACITPRTRAICGVHAFGVPCRIDELQHTARKHDLLLLFDSAHAFGARFNRRYVGGFGDAEVFSLSATKVVPAGEGGLVVTNDPALHEAVLDRRNYGLAHDRSGDCRNQGWNAKMTEFHAILAIREIETLEWRIARRNAIAKRYHDGLADVPGLRFQRVPEGDVSTFKDFTVQVDPRVFGVTRDELREKLKQAGIETAPYFAPPLHHMTMFQPFVRPGQMFPETERISASILSLPLFETITNDEIDEVVTAVRGAAAHRDSAIDRRVVGGGGR
jgi:dTDP-4-amino-4,6-dideoxygalactose transaminase